MSVSSHLSVHQKQSLRQRLSQRGQMAVKLLGLSFEDAEALIETEALSNPVLKPVRRSSGAPISEIIENTASGTVSLIDHLTAQMGEVFDLTPRVKTHLEYLIGSLDEQGYLRERPDWIETEAGAEAYEILRSFDPAGVGASSLLDCFALQLQRQGEWSDQWQALFEKADLMERQDFPALARHLNICMSDLRVLMDQLRTLSPDPAAGFVQNMPLAPPDLVVRTLKSGETVVELTRDREVRVAVDRDAVEALRQIESDPAHRDYVKDQLAHARWVRQICKQRGETLLSVAEYAVAIQYQAIHDGIGHVRALTMRSVAEALKVHESTISRAVAHKMIMTPIGCIALRDLFSASSCEGQTSVTAVRQSIQALVGAEDAASVLSDQEIADELANSGVSLSRRSVAKHRKALGVAGARERSRRHALYAQTPA